MTTNERMRLVREEAGDNFTKCGEIIGISRSAVSMIEAGKNKPSNQTIEVFCREYKINREWLETGEGPMKKEIPPRDEVAEIIYDVLQIGEDDPVYGFVLHFLKTYQQMKLLKMAAIK